MTNGCCQYCGVPLDAEYFDELSIIDKSRLPKRGERVILARVELVVHNRNFDFEVNEIESIGGRILGRYWFNSDYGGQLCDVGFGQCYRSTEA